ncbi:hypothetical protein F5880DRAFT_1512139 [Lentinula raphanica]|nr:hypothetical protein F5880DRAFT_1512139 [Lentinula raphanica]
MANKLPSHLRSYVQGVFDDLPLYSQLLLHRDMSSYSMEILNKALCLKASMNNSYELDPGPQHILKVLAGQKRTRHHPHSEANGLNDTDQFPTPKRFRPFVKRWIQARCQNLRSIEGMKRPSYNRPYYPAPPKQVYTPGQVMSNIYGPETSTTTHYGDGQQSKFATPNSPDSIILPVDRPFGSPEFGPKDDATSIPLVPPIPCHEHTPASCSTATRSCRSFAK